MPRSINQQSCDTEFLKRIIRQLDDPSKVGTLPGSELYWIMRYQLGGNSGTGSHGTLAEFKAVIINEFVKEEGIKTVIEFGSGDGNQLKYAQYPHYIGFDVSARAISDCRKMFSDDSTKQFRLVGNYQMEKAQLTLSLDVIYHLIEDRVYTTYMKRLFEASEQYVIIYSSNTNKTFDQCATHIRHRRFSNWIEDHEQQWKMVRHIPNKRSHIDLFIYKFCTETGFSSLNRDGNSHER